jgi:CRP-like cAMP-binding protein
MQLYPVPQNLLLRALSRAKAQVPAGKLQHLTFDAGQALWAAEDTAPYAVFPLRGALSLQLSPGGGKMVEIAILGREGFAGVSLIPGAERTRTGAVAISPGEALVMSRETFRKALGTPAFRTAIDRYTQLHVAILAQMVACNRVHVIEKVAVGRLLQVHDRVRAESIQLTQDVFARQLGVRRASISRVVTGLQKNGLITYDRRGRITIVNRPELERQACPCYHRIKSEFDRHVEQQGGL